MRKYFILIIIFVVTNVVFSQIQITSSNFNYSQNFNTLANTGTNLPWTNNSTIPGWFSTESTYNPDDGSIGVPHKDSLLSLGSAGSTDRALGDAITGRGSPISYGIEFVNNSGHTITQITISYYGEQWYSGGTTPNTLTFSYLINGTSITSGTWKTVSQLNFNSPNNSGSFTNIDGNNSLNRTSISYALPITLNQGDNVWLKWTDTDEPGTDDILSIDDFNFTITGALPVELTEFSAAINDNKVNLNWQTATEVNNYGFDVERASLNPTEVRTSGTPLWETIGFVKGHGNSNSPKQYSFVDPNPGSGKVEYRLKQIDNDGSFKYSDAVIINVGVPDKAELLQNVPNPFNPTTTIKFYIPNTSKVIIQIYNLLGEKIKTLIDREMNAGYHIIYWNGRDGFGTSAASGVYLYRLVAGNFVQTKKMVLLK